MFAAARAPKQRTQLPDRPSGRRHVQSGRRQGAGAQLSRIPGLVALAALVGCATIGAPEDDVAGKIRSYYAAHAIEEAGVCPSPEIASITKRKLQATEALRTRLRVRYSYFDPSQGSTPAWMPSVLLAARACTGFAERDFVLEREKLGYRVVDMSGPRRDQ